MMGQILLRSLLYPLLFLLTVPLLPWPVQAASAPAAPRMTATVVEFSVRGDLPEQTGAILADLMVAAIANTGRFTLKDRLSLLAVAKIAKAQELGSTGLLDPKTAAELGRRYEVDAVVIGEVSKLGNLINVTARLIDTRNASLLRSGQIQGKNLDAIQIEVNQLASMIIAPPEPPRTFALTVRTEPADARVRLLNVPLTYQPGMQLSPGEYQVEVTHPGYVTHTGPVRIEDRDATLNVALRKALYALTIEPQPVDAQVRLAGNAPPYRPGVALEPGEYPVEVSREGYVTRRFPVRVVDGEVRVPVVLEKQPPVASAPPGGYRLNVYTHPEKATVRLLDSKLAYQAGGRLPPGEYRIEVALDGYESSTLAVRIIDSDVTVPVTLKPVERPTVYRLTVQARPANAQVRLVDSESTYQPGVRLAPGRYTVEVAATGYATATVPVRIVDSDVTLPVTLNREEAVAAPPPPPTQYRLTVRADPANAQVRLLGTRTRYQAGVALKPGRYTVEVAASGYQTRQVAVTLSDADVTLPVSLVREPEPPPPTQYRLTVRPDPANAQVRLLGTRTRYQAGVALKPGRYTVEVAASGYQTRQVAVTLSDADVTLPVSLNRTPEPVAAPEAPPPPAQYRLTVRASPSGARVRLVNAPYTYRAGVALAPGRYTVEVSRSGYEAQQVVVTIRDSDVVLPVTLQALESAPPATGTYATTRPGEWRISSVQIDSALSGVDRSEVQKIVGRYVGQTINRDALLNAATQVYRSTGVTLRFVVRNRPGGAELHAQVSRVQRRSYESSVPIITSGQLENSGFGVSVE
ncbi:MAG: hypothetical protein EKK69_08880 [Candidatus Competibacteraceae bacterium]|nr:MAG: hypothetical protein EKK69_08880 [Candidatus Competibacteraceae bacterium]